MPTLLVNDQEVEFGDDERLNGIQAAARAGVEIPHYCWHPGLSVVASCRMCLVESGRRDPETGDVQMVPKLVPACQTPATENAVFVTDSEKVQRARAMVEEDLLLNHPIDCPICDKAGECHLQDYHFQFGQDERRADIRPFTSRRRSLGDTVTLFVDRCVMCSRCVRFCREISGTSELMVTNRGVEEEIDVFPGFPLENKLAGNVVDLCPVGALGDKDFLYSQRVWFMQNRDHVCAGCSAGCSIHVDENQDRIYRVRPRENQHVNGWWMCDEGRYGVAHVHDPLRVTELRRFEADQHVNIEWSALADELGTRLSGCQRLAAVLSPQLTVEEAYLLAQYVRGIDGDAILALGPVPSTGQDESFPGGFTIRAEKCPNRRGVEEIIKGIAGPLVTFDEFLPMIAQQSIDGIWVTGGYPSNWIDPAWAEKLSTATTLIVQDLFHSPLWEQAAYQVPSAAFAERSGSYVNCADRLQSFEWAIRPPAGVTVDGQLYWRLLNRAGLYQPRRVLDDIAREIPYFAVATDPVPSVGVDLKLNQLAVM